MKTESKMTRTQGVLPNWAPNVRLDFARSRTGIRRREPAVVSARIRALFVSILSLFWTLRKAQTQPLRAVAEVSA